MRQSRSILPIRPLVLESARLGRRKRWLAPTAVQARTRFEQSNLAVARVASPVWLRGPLFLRARAQLPSSVARHVA